MQPLSPKQAEAYVNSDARFNLFEGSIRAGKSYSALLKFLKWSAEDAPAGPLLLSGKTRESIYRNVITEIMSIVGHRTISYNSTRGILKFRNKEYFIIAGKDERSYSSLLGSTFAGALIDEVSLLPENFFTTLLGRISIEGAMIIATTNPESPFHWLKRKFIDRIESDKLPWKVFSFRITDNPSLSQDYIDSICKEHTGLLYQRRILGKWVAAEGSIFPFFDRTVHTIDHPNERPHGHIVGIDYGSSNPTCFMLIGFALIEGNHEIWLEREYYHDSIEVGPKSDYQYTLDFLEWSKDVHLEAIYMDPSARSLEVQFQELGINGIVKADNSVIEGIQFMSSLLHDRVYKIKKTCTKAIEEIEGYRWDPKASQRGLDRPIKSADHSIDAQRYALFTHFFNKLNRTGYSQQTIDTLNFNYRPERMRF